MRPMSRLRSNSGLIDKRIPDIDALIATLRTHNIKPIARIVCFNDPVLAKKMPALAVKSKSTGGNWKDNKLSMYTNPYNRQVWEYLTELGRTRPVTGSRRFSSTTCVFPSDGNISDTLYPRADREQGGRHRRLLGYTRAPAREDGCLGIRGRFRAHSVREG